MPDDSFNQRLESLFSEDIKQPEPPPKPAAAPDRVPPAPQDDADQMSALFSTADESLIPPSSFPADLSQPATRQRSRLPARPLSERRQPLPEPAPTPADDVETLRQRASGLRVTIGNMEREIAEAGYVGTSARDLALRKAELASIERRLAELAPETPVDTSVPAWSKTENSALLLGPAWLPEPLRRLVAAPRIDDDIERQRIAQLVNTMLWLCLAGMAVMLFGATLPGTPTALRNLLVIIMPLGMVVDGGLIVLNRQGRVETASFALVGLLFTLMTLIVIQAGTVASALSAGYLTILAAAAFILRRRMVVAYMLLVAVAVVGVYALELSGLLPPPMPGSALFMPISVLIFFFVAGGILTLSSRSLSGVFQTARESELALADANAALAATQLELEGRVEERTRDLRLAFDVVRTVSGELDFERLLDQVVTLIRDEFDLYYAGIFLVDDNEQFAVLRAGTGEAGQAMMSAGHRLAIGGTSMIGDAVSRQVPRISEDVGEEQVFYANPFLPDTRSEMALPLVARGRVIGAMTIQSRARNAFDETTIDTLEGMADLIAVAIDNALLIEQSQTLLREMDDARRQETRMAWAPYMRQADSPFTAPIEIPGLEQAVQQGRTQLMNSDLGQALTVPLQLRSEIIGALSLEADTDQWSDDELALVEAVADQAALALDNARLIDETRRLAQREQLINEITARIRRSPDITSIMQTAITELGRVLAVNDVAIQIGDEESLVNAARQFQSDGGRRE